MRFVVGITGKIGSGKTTVSQIFSELGATVIDVDKVAHQLLEKEELKNLLVRHFGKDIIVNGKIDRKKLASIVFSDRLKLLKLEAIVHPPLKLEIQKLLENLKGLVVIDAAILHRIGLDELCDLIVIVKAPHEIIVERLRRKGMSNSEIERRLLLQEDIPQEGTVIVNDGDFKNLRDKVEKIYQMIKLKLESM